MASTATGSHGDGGGSPSGLVIRRISHIEPQLLSALTKHGRSALGESALDHWLLPVVAVFGALYIAESEGEIVGAAEIIRAMADGDLYLEGFYIVPEFQRRGFGSRMMEKLPGLLASEGYKRLLATVDPENLAALRLYEKTGFRQEAYLPDHYGPDRHRLLMSLRLAGGGPGGQRGRREEDLG